MTTYVFPGQGSQTVGMGAELFDQFPEALATANEILGYDLRSLCLEDPQGVLNQTQYTQPALYSINAMTAWAQGSGAPAFAAGHSLGEYNALLAAEVFDFATGLQLVQKRGALMAEAKGGGMAAIIGLSAEQVQSVLTDMQATTVSVANINSPQQTVITGEKAAVEALSQAFTDAGAKRFVLLPVSGAFHSPFMQAAADEFASFVQTFSFNAPKFPVIANSTAQPYEADKVVATLVEQITSPVRWVESIQYLSQQGESEFIEIGPGKVLSGLIRRIL